MARPDPACGTRDYNRIQNGDEAATFCERTSTMSQSEQSKSSLQAFYMGLVTHSDCLGLTNSTK